MMEGVSILPFHGENIITLREYRYPIRSWQTELPGGLIDPGETPKQAAVRELKEETGYEAEEVISLGYFYPSFGSTDEKIHLFAIQCGKLGEESLDPAEVLKIHEVSIKEFQELVATGEVKHGAGLAAWARWMSREKDEKKWKENRRKYNGYNEVYERNYFCTISQKGFSFDRDSKKKF